MSSSPPGTSAPAHATADAPTKGGESSAPPKHSLREDGRLAVGSHRDDIQGLRGVAVLLVALGHAGVGFLKGGFIGVDVFFVLSGFLITGLLLSGATRHRPGALERVPRRLRVLRPSTAAVLARQVASITEFYARRARRILPAAALTLVVTDVVAYQLLNFVRAKQIVLDSIWASLFAANVHFAHEGTEYFSRGQPPSPIQHFWTLAVEEQFYLVWPALFSLVLLGVALRRRSRDDSMPDAGAIAERAARPLLIAISLIAIASLAWSLYDTDASPASAFFSTFTRAWELALGAALALGAVSLLRLPGGVRAAMGWLGLAGIGAAGVLLSSSTPFPGYAALLPTVGAALVIGAGIGHHRHRLGVGRVLAVAPLRYVGDRSYAFYLWHWPALILPRQYEGHELSVGVNLLLLLGAFVLSMVSYRFFENPIRRGEPLLDALLGWRPLRRLMSSYAFVRSRQFEERRPLSYARSLLFWPASAAVVVLIAGVILNSIDNKETQLEVAAARTPSSLEVATDVPGRPTAASASRPLPAVKAAVKAAERSADLPSGLNPPVNELLNPDFAYSFPPGCAPRSDRQTTSKVCSLGNPSSKRSIVVFGDSHAQMWMPALLPVAQQDGWVVRPLVKSACNPNKWVDDVGTGECRAWYRWAVRQIKALRPDVTLITGAYGGATGGTATRVENGIFSLAESIKRHSKRVVAMADTDGVNQQPVDCLLAKGATMASCTTKWTQLRFAANDSIGARAERGGFGYFRTRGWFCAGDQCPMVIGRTVVYRDRGHVTETYAQQLTKPFRAELRRVVRGSKRR